MSHWKFLNLESKTIDRFLLKIYYIFCVNKVNISDLKFCILLLVRLTLATNKPFWFLSDLDLQKKFESQDQGLETGLGKGLEKSRQNHEDPDQKTDILDQEDHRLEVVDLTLVIGQSQGVIGQGQEVEGRKARVRIGIGGANMEISMLSNSQKGTVCLIKN